MEIIPKNTALEADITTNTIIEIIPKDFDKVFSIHKKKGKIKTIAKDNSLVSQ